MRVVMLAAGLALSGCATGSLSIVSPDGKRVETLNLDAWLKAHPAPTDREITIQELGRNRASSFHLVQVRTKEKPHLHKGHDAVVLMQQGSGTLFLGPHQLRLSPGSIVNVPRGVAHHFVSDSPQPAVAFVVFSPPFDGIDIIPVDAPSPGASHPTSRSPHGSARR